MNDKAFQDYYDDEASCCYGCGRLNEHGLQIKTYWQGEETVTVFEPEPYHCGITGFIYGGLIASLIDCHAMATATAAAYRAEGRAMDTDPSIRFVTALLEVRYVRPTPAGLPLEIRGRVQELKGRKAIIGATLSAEGRVCAQGKVVGVRIPESMRPAAQKERGSSPGAENGN